MKGYVTSSGYMGYVDGQYMLFSTEDEYYEYIKEREMEELIEKMDKYWETHEATIDDGGLMFFDDTVDDETGEIVRLLWDNLFVGSHWNPETRDFVREHGYSTRVFERDSFGILIAGVGKDGKWFSIG